MTREIVLNDDRHRLWVALQLGLGASAFPTACGSVGLEDDGMIIAATIYTNHDVFPTTGVTYCWASIAGLPGVNWCTRRYVKAILTYPFEVLGVRVVRTMCDRQNKQARQFNRKLGLRQSGIARHGWDGRRDAVHYDLLPQDAEKWLGYRPTAWQNTVAAFEELREEADGRR